jgi:hypothetical protein
MTETNSQPVARPRRTECCCCGGDAGRWLQWHNRDEGYGICLDCVTWFRQEKRYTDADIQAYYGTEGVHWGATITVGARTYRAVAAFKDSKRGTDNANAWMAANPTHALLHTGEGYLWLADAADMGTPL